jgi:cell division protein ZapA (FtsZ GTPase activity inhibitor)
VLADVAGVLLRLSTVAQMEIHEIEERKNRHINDLMKNHEKAFAEMKGYYNNITQDNLALIKTLNVRTCVLALALALASTPENSTSLKFADFLPPAPSLRTTSSS